VDSRYANLGGTSAGQEPAPAPVSGATTLGHCQEQLELMSLLLENVGDGIIAHTLDGVLVYVNEVASRTLGYAPGEMLDLEPWGWVTPDRVHHIADRIDSIRVQDDLLYETTVRTKSGDSVAAEAHSRIVNTSGHGELIVSVCRDVTARTAAHENMRRLAYHDVLTGLGNRVMLEERVKRALEQASEQSVVGLVYLDLDDFKPINDTYGHTVGDRVLQIIGERLRACVRDSDTIARMGGDEFIALFPGLASEEDLGPKALALARCISQPIGIDGITTRVSASVGLSTYELGEHPEDFITRADHAMYRAKLHGVAGWEEFIERLQDQVTAP